MSENKSNKLDQSPKLPGTFKQFIARFPQLGDAHEQIAQAALKAGPLDEKTCLLVKVGICVGADMESALKANIRKAMQAGATEAEIEQVIVQAMNTVGFPSTVKAWSWAKTQFARGL